MFHKKRKSIFYIFIIASETFETYMCVCNMCAAWVFRREYWKILDSNNQRLQRGLSKLTKLQNFPIISSTTKSKTYVPFQVTNLCLVWNMYGV